MSVTELEQHRAFAGVIDILEAIGIEYMIWGGVAAVAYGEPRFTHDMDIVLKLDGSVARLMARALEEGGYHVSLPAILEVLWGGYFNVIHLATNVKIDCFVSLGDPLIRWAFQNRRILPFDEIREAAYMSPEAVILTKLRVYQDSGSTRHLDDIAGIVRVSGDILNRWVIEQEAAKMGTLGVWRGLWESAARS